MLLASGVLCRAAAEVPKTSPHHLPQLARFLRRTLLTRNATTAPAARALSRAYASALHARRSYATTARATKPTATVKKAVKADAKKAAPKKATTAKKAAPAKKTAAAKKPARKTAARKTAAKKAAPKKRVKKVLTPEEKEKAKIRELRVKALKEPVSRAAGSGFNAYIAEVCLGKGSSLEVVRTKVSDAAGKWKDLTPAEHEHYNHIANEKTAAKRAEYQAWVLSHTPDQIRIANNARAQLRRLLGPRQKRQVAYTTRIVDDRQMKRTSPYNFFLKERHASGDFKGIKSTEAVKLVANEWKALGAAEKKKYEDMNAAQKAKATA